MDILLIRELIVASFLNLTKLSTYRLSKKVVSLESIMCQIEMRNKSVHVFLPDCGKKNTVDMFLLERMKFVCEYVSCRMREKSICECFV